jgi:hypothetical protein
MQPNGPHGPDTYLVVVADFVVLQDLADAIRGFDPEAVILTHNARADALASLEAHDRISVAFVEAGPELVEASKLDVAVEQRGGRLVLLGDDAEAELEAGSPLISDWLVMPRPFSNRTILNWLAPGGDAKT